MARGIKGKGGDGPLQRSQDGSLSFEMPPSGRQYHFIPCSQTKPFATAWGNDLGNSRQEIGAVWARTRHLGMARRLGRGRGSRGGAKESGRERGRRRGVKEREKQQEAETEKNDDVRGKNQNSYM